MNFKRAVRGSVPPGLLKGQSLARAVAAQAAHGIPARKLKVVGVTGTDGKSSTCLIIASVLRASGAKVAVLSTIGVDLADGKGLRPSPRHMTTAGQWNLAKLIKQIKRNKPDWLVMEVSSHALDQRRVWGIPFSAVVMTNISHEHLDYHGSMPNYIKAKLKLFELANKNRRGFRVGVINADDDSAALFSTAVANPISYGINRGDLQAKNINLTSQGLSYQLKGQQGDIEIKSHLLGKYNVYNTLAAAAVGLAVGLSREQVAKGIADLTEIPGRMSQVETGKDFKVFIDYAVTPNALTNLLELGRQLAGEDRVILVFGATGDRDRAKRPSMGQAAAKADLVFLTDDETYGEDPAKIRAAVYEGLKETKAESKTSEVDDRRKAIAQALKSARAGDVVLITGLGHQTSRNMGGVDQPWSDAETVQQLLKSKS